MADAIKRPNETVLDGAIRVARDALYEVRDRGGDMHQAGESAARQAVLLAVTALIAMMYPEEFPDYDPDHKFWDGMSEFEIEEFRKAVRRGKEPPAVFEWDSSIGEWCGSWARDLFTQLKSKEANDG